MDSESHGGNVENAIRKEDMKVMQATAKIQVADDKKPDYGIKDKDDKTRAEESGSGNKSDVKITELRMLRNILMCSAFRLFNRI